MKDISTSIQKLRVAQIYPDKSSIETQAVKQNKNSSLPKLKKMNTEILEKVMNYIEHQEKAKKTNNVKFNLKGNKILIISSILIFLYKI